jgi:hypothetical protein
MWAPDGLGGKFRVTKEVGEKLDADMKGMTVLLRLWSDGERPLKSFTRVWLHSKKVLERKRLLIDPSSNSTFIKKYAQGNTLKFLWEIIEAMQSVATSILQVLRTRPKVIDRALRRWLTLDGHLSGKARMHPVAYEWLMKAPHAEATNLMLLLEIEVAELHLVKERLQVMSKNNYSHFAIWVWFADAAQHAIRNECSWLSALNYPHIVATRERNRSLNKDIWTMTELVDRKEVQADSIRKNKAEVGRNNASNEQRKAIKAIKEVVPILKNLGGQGAAAGVAGVGVYHQKPDAQKKPNVTQLREQLNNLVSSKKPALLTRAAGTCIFHAHGLKCNDYDTQSSPDYCKGKGRRAKQRRHLCLCGGKHQVITCKVWFRN